MAEVYKDFFQTYIFLFVIIFGLILGSFANVLIWRVPRKLSIIKPKSHCPKCNHLLKWYENIPILSYLFLKGKCSNCHTSISFRYPMVELATVGLALWPALRWQGELLPIGYALFASPILIALIVIDWEFLELPDTLVFSLGVIGIVNVAIANGSLNLIATLVVTTSFLLISGLLWWMWRRPSTQNEVNEEEEDEHLEPSLNDRLLWGGGAFLLGAVATVGSIIGNIHFSSFISLWGMLTGSGLLLTLWGVFVFLKGEEYIGLGDVKLMGALGIPMGPYVMLLSFVISAVIGIVTWCIGKWFSKHSSTQPFAYGPALILGVWISWMYGQQWIEWYLNFLF
ncbi:MAG: prepilin peptidase [bacterium]|nr:prepilin peptidase [bacterium]